MCSVLFCGLYIEKDRKVKDIFFNLFGIGFSKFEYVCRKVGLSSSITFKFLSLKQFIYLENFLFNNFLFNELLYKKYKNFFKIQIKIRSYRGLRNRQGLPCRGQGTHNNAKTSKRLKVKYRVKISQVFIGVPFFRRKGKIYFYKKKRLKKQIFFRFLKKKRKK